jgi:hypothetical protein
MRATYRVTAMIFAVPLVVLGTGCAGTVEAGGSLPNPVKSCQDVRAYIGADNSMTMDTFKKLLIASGQNLAGAGEQGLDSTCKLTALSKNVVMSQHVLTKPDGTEISAKTEVIVDHGVCKLTNVSLSGC